MGEGAGHGVEGGAASPKFLPTRAKLFQRICFRVIGIVPEILLQLGERQFAFEERDSLRQ